MRNGVYCCAVLAEGTFFNVFIYEGQIYFRGSVRIVNNYRVSTRLSLTECYEKQKTAVLFGMGCLSRNKTVFCLLNALCSLSTRGSQWEIMWTVGKLWLKFQLWSDSDEPVLIDCSWFQFYTTYLLVPGLCKTKFSCCLSFCGHLLSRTWFFLSMWKRHISRHQKFDLLPLQKCFSSFVSSQMLELVHLWTVYLKI